MRARLWKMYSAHLVASGQEVKWARRAWTMACSLPSSSSVQRAVAHGLLELVDGENRVVTAAPKPVAHRRAVFVRADFRGGIGKCRIRKFFGNDELRLRRINAAFCREQIPIALEGDAFGIRERELTR